MTRSRYRLLLTWAIVALTGLTSNRLHAQNTLHLTLTNSVLQENAGILHQWAQLDVVPCPTQALTVALSVSDSSELWVTNSVQLSTNQCSVQFDLVPIWDSIVDGGQTLTLTASAPHYTSSVVTIDVLHAGGAERQLRFKSDALLSEFEQTQVWPALTGPADFNFSACLVREDLDEIHILLNRSSTLWPSIQVYQTNGTYLRQIQLPQFDDSEGFCIVDAATNLYAIIEEGSTDRITLLTITTNDTSVSRNAGLSYSLTLPNGKFFNKGLEGIIYDDINDCFYSVQERDPMGVYRIQLGPSNATLDVLFDAEKIFEGIATDLSDITFDPVSGHLLILSDESKRILECGLDGTIHSMRSVVATQPEGLYYSSDQKILYVTGEDSELLRWNRRAPNRTVQEGSNLVIDVALSFPSDSDTAFGVASTGHTATAFIDFLPPTNMFTFATGETCQTLVVPVPITTNTVEMTEQFRLALVSTSSNTIEGAISTVTVLIPGDAISLFVASQYGTASPPQGPQFVAFGDDIVLSVTDSPVVLSGATQYVCTGWIGTGSVPGSGAGTQTGTLQITNESSITWLWATNYWLGTAANAGGTVNGGNQWLPPGSTNQIEAVSDAYYNFQGWTGDVMPGEETNTVLDIYMVGPKFLTAVFQSQNTSNGIPYAWLTTYYSPTNDFELLILTDTDGDGHTASQEYLADTSPIDPDDVLKLTRVHIRTFNPRAQVQFMAVPTRRFDVYRHTILSDTTSVTRIANNIRVNRRRTITVTDPAVLMNNAFYSLDAHLP